MQMTLVALGKTQAKWIAEGIAIYEQRLRHYGKFNFMETPDIKLKQAKADSSQVMKAEAAVLESYCPVWTT
jgi:23S rRNA (pseudouridine1915-N3)-methyltransferase